MACASAPALASTEGEADGDALTDGLELAGGLVLAPDVGLAEAAAEADALEETAALAVGVGHVVADDRANAAAQDEALLDADGDALLLRVPATGLTVVTESGLT